MSDEGVTVTRMIEKIFQDVGGFTWEQAETWAGFCNAVGMDPLPYLKVMLTNVCEVRSTYDKGNVPSSSACPELWVVTKGFRTEFKLLEPNN
jgi:hypothetical protein